MEFKKECSILKPVQKQLDEHLKNMMENKNLSSAEKNSMKK